MILFGFTSLENNSLTNLNLKAAKILWFVLK